MNCLYSRTITIDYTKCGTTFSTDFPMLIQGTFSYLKTIPNGGCINATSSQTGGGTTMVVPADFKLTSDSSGDSALAWEFERWDQTTGSTVIWVKIPTLSSTANTVIYMFYGGSDWDDKWTGNITGVWNSGYKGVWHLPDGTTLSPNDSTTNAYDMTNVGTIGPTSGNIGGAVDCVNNTGKYLNRETAIVNAPPCTVSVWIKFDLLSATQIIGGPGGGNSSPSYASMDLRQNPSGFISCLESNSNGGIGGQSISGATISTGVWYHAVGVFTTSSNRQIYLNGVPGTASTTTATVNSANYQRVRIGISPIKNAGSTLQPVDGQISNFTVSNVARSGSYILSEYNNQSNPDTFYTIGSELTGIIFDTASNSGYQTSSSYSWSHTTYGPDRYLVVGISMLSLAQTVTSITYNSINLSYIGSQNSTSGACRVEMWGMTAPTLGTNTILVTLSGAISSIGNATSWYGVHQSAPYEGMTSSQATNGGSPADATIGVISVADNDMVVDVLCTDDTSVTVGAGQTQSGNVTGAGGSGAMSYEGYKSPAGTVTMSWTGIGAAQTWSQMGIALRGATNSNPVFSGNRFFEVF